MKIRHISICNLRAIEALDLDLGPAESTPLDLAVLAGPNGCGKLRRACGSSGRRPWYRARCPSSRIRSP
jgi:hypothetical protein